MHVCIYLSLYMYMCLSVCIYAYMYVYIYLYVCMYVCMYIYVHICICICPYICVYVHTYMYTYVKKELLLVSNKRLQNYILLSFLMTVAYVARYDSKTFLCMIIILVSELVFILCFYGYNYTHMMNECFI